MEPITAYHVVTDRQMAVGQHIIFDENHHSGVYSRVMALTDAVADVYAHPEKYELPLEHHLDVALRELAMEEVRREKYPQYPSHGMPVCQPRAGGIPQVGRVLRAHRPSDIRHCGAEDYGPYLCGQRLQLLRRNAGQSGKSRQGRALLAESPQ